MYYGVWKLANNLIDSKFYLATALVLELVWHGVWLIRCPIAADEFRNDPRNRNRPAQTAPAKIEPKA